MKDTSARRRTRAQRGYSIIELMVVIAIIGILAAVAIPSFMGYLRKSKTSEAISFLGAIKQRQAAYYAEMGQYCDVNDDNPSSVPSGGDTLGWENDDGWNQLGAAPDTPSVYFQYNTYAGPPGDGETPNARYGAVFNSDRGYEGATFWFISRAVGDLDGDSDLVTFESYSGNASLWISHGSGWD